MLIQSLSIKVCACLGLLILLTGCGKFNYEYMFPVDREIHQRAQTIPGADGFECTIFPAEFGKLKNDIKHRFPEWRKIDETIIIYSGDKFELVIKPEDAALYTRGEPFDGYEPVIVYYPAQNKVIFLAANGWM